MNSTLLCFVFFAALFYLVFTFLSTSPKPTNKVLTEPRIFGNVQVQKAFADNNACALGALSKLEGAQLFWDAMTEILNDCVMSTDINRINVKGYANKEEKKYHVQSEGGNQEIIVTIGVGLDISAEEALKADSVEEPVFFGADPVYEENDEIFSKIGIFFPFAIGAKMGIETVKALKNGAYKDIETVQVDLNSFLKHFVSRSFIDAIWMDAEGQEYEMLPQLENGGILAQSGITVCQWNLEIHNPDDQRKREIQSFILQILRDSTYAILQASRSSDFRIFLLNFANEGCVSKFIQQFYAE